MVTCTAFPGLVVTVRFIYLYSRLNVKVFSYPISAPISESVVAADSLDYTRILTCKHVHPCMPIW